METAQLQLDQVSLQAQVGLHHLLQNISFNVFPGDRVAIVGPSGAGKTSLLRLLNRLNDATQGKIYFEGKEIRQYPVIQLRQQIALVPQESRLLGMTVRQALAYPLRLQRLPQSTIQQRLTTWIERLHLPSDWLDRTELQLSVGQRQWVSIARSLITHPKILLLDEPTSALDTGRGNHLIAVLTDLTATQPLTILMANHQLDLAEQFCTRMLYLDQGQLLYDRPSHQVNWPELKQQLIDAEAEATAGWE